MGFIQEIKNSLLKGFSVYLGTSVINKALPFFLLPILTKYLSTAEYGTLAVFQVLISFSRPFVGMNMTNVISRYFFRKRKKYLAKLLFNILFILSITTSLLLLIVTIYVSVGMEFVEIPNRWLYSLPVIAAMNMVNEFNLTILRNEKEELQFGAYEVSKTVIDLFVTLILVVVYLYGWEGRAGGILIATFLIAVISLYNLWNKRYISVEIDGKVLKEIIYISFPLILHSFGISLITLSDRLFIDRMVSTSAVGIYTVGYQFGMIMTLVVTAFSRTWSPWIYELLAEGSDENKIVIVKTTYLVSACLVLLAILITALANVLLPFMTAAEYHGGTTYVIWIAMGYAFNGMYTLVFPYGVHVGRTSYLGITTFSAAIVNLIANYYLISLNGALGAAQATLLSYIIMFASVWWYSNKLYPMPWFKFSQSNVN